jgi:hypothetical protein
LPKYPGIINKLEELSLKGVVETCLFPNGDGDLLGSMKTPVLNNETGEIEDVSIRDQIVDMIKGSVDAIFDPLSQAPPANQEMAAMDDLNKVLALLSDVDAFYSYVHEAELSPPFPSSTTFLAATDSTAADYDPRATDEQTCTDGVIACPALAARLRASSLACEEYTVPPGSFDGQPDQPVPGLSYVLESINTYDRATDGQTTSVSCTLTADNSTLLVSTVAPMCKTNDKGLCAAMCAELYPATSQQTELGTCASLCTGDLTAANEPAVGAYAVAVAANPTIADGIDSTEMTKYCPPIAAYRAISALVDMTNADVFACYDFDCAGFNSLAECAVLDDVTLSYNVPIASQACKKSELVASFTDAAATLKFAIKDVETTATDMQPAIATQLKELLHSKLVNPFVALIDAETMDCSFMSGAFLQFLDGACYNFGGAVASYANIFTLCSRCGFLLVFLMFGLWRHFINMFDAAKKEAADGGKTGSGGRDDPSMYCEHGVYTHDPCPQCEAGK